MTSNLPVHEELVPDPDIELILLGGLVRRNKSLVGFLTEDCVRQGARLSMGTSAVRSDGTVVNTTVVEVPAGGHDCLGRPSRPCGGRSTLPGSRYPPCVGRRRST